MKKLILIIPASIFSVITFAIYTLMMSPVTMRNINNACVVAFS
ncbi:MAG TPA: hypothetical protein QF753_14855 [Victivallales bacterium]|nr:hypothetical protein [Victivallales bacterium]